MPDYSIQFTSHDVLEKFLDLRDLKGKQKKKALVMLEHELIGCLASAISSAYIFRNNDEMLFGKQPSLHQKAYVDNLISSGNLMITHLEDLVELCSKKFDKTKIVSQIKRSSESLVDIMCSLPQYLPASKQVSQLGNISEIRLEELEKMDLHLSMTFYTYNLEFAKQHMKDTYNLKKDVNMLWISQSSQKETKHPIKMGKPDVLAIETKADYLKNAVMPLVKNIAQHAYNPKNDIYGRLNDKDNPMNKRFIISSEANEQKKEIVITVQDNGFGIKPEIERKLFKEEVSTKKDSITQHGIGLQGVKQFVESKGGKVWAETELGRGTSFKFTIPYDERDHFIYEQ
ncbi:MAG: ATP-binding protein [Nanoarchaeota archaeon]|nr:ATP-binding protein [Nanoarchaeota archaeon]